MGLFSQIMRGHGLQTVRPARAGFGYDTFGDEMLCSLFIVIANHKDAIRSIAHKGSAVANGGKNTVGLD